MITIKRIAYLIIMMLMLADWVLAQPVSNTLLQDIQIKIITADEIKVFLKFSAGKIPAAKVQRKDNDLM